MAAASIPSTSGIKQTPLQNTKEERAHHPTVEELLIQIENHLYKSIEHRASLLIVVWSCLSVKNNYFRNLEKIFHMLYRESAMTIFCGHWPKVNIVYKRGLARALIQFSHNMSQFVKGSEGLCSALVLATYDPWGDPMIPQLISKEAVDEKIVDDFIRSEPYELLLIRIECLVNAHFEDAAIRLCQGCLRNHSSNPANSELECTDDEWKWVFMEWLLRLLYRKGRLDELVAASSSYSCHDGVRLVYRTRSSQMPDSEHLTETLINLFLIRDLLFQSDYCCTSELMKLWCDFQIQKQKSFFEIQESARKLLVGHASSSAQFYLFVDTLWEKFGASLLPVYLEMYIHGLTSDLNFLEAARQADNKESVIEIENHMAAMYFKLSSMFNVINKEISLECMLSAFSLDPTKERLDWIKKLSLQISKDKAVRASKDEMCKHKACSKTNPHSLHPPAKRKAVLMCDQAIQVSDDSFENPEETVDAGACNHDQVQNEGQNFSTNETQEKQLMVEKTENIIPEESVNCINADKVDDSPAKVESSVNCKELLENDKSKELPAENGYEENEIENKVKCVQENESEVLDLTSNKRRKNQENSEKEAPTHNGDIVEDVAKENSISSLNCKNMNNCDSLAHDEDAKIVCNNVNADVPITNTKNCIENHLVSKDDKSDLSQSVKNEKESCDVVANCDDSKEKNEKASSNSDNCIVNGHEELESKENCKNQDENKSNGIAANQEHCDDVENPVTNTCNENEKGNENEKNITDKEIFKLPDTPHCLDVSKETEDTVNTEKEKQDENHCEVSKLNINEENLICPLDSKTDKSLKNICKFSHIVLDSKISGVSCDLLSDFVIVLESLRNRQLKSSTKWSQIKHLCEDYLDNVSNIRCMMLNMQLNESIDSEADSVSEARFGGFKDFQSHQSDESVVEDPYTEKTHVLKRFMNEENIGNMATYVNLSDIHCPQIPIEKLFYTDHSSSHLGHKKRHKKHRNHEKNPEKVVLRKLHHGSRAERELGKRKKRKKRKGKRGKNHAKKHHFTHGKISKGYVKNKKKKHHLKKKKENSGFISGDYCSDFSSAELMRLVNEHSNSYSKVPATVSKHPRSGVIPCPSAASSDSDEPSRKKRKVSFDKKKGKAGKYHDKHKHEKSKSSKRKKKLAVTNRESKMKSIMPPNAVNNNIDSMNDYSRIVQFASVKKMEAVQIHQRSVALNLSSKINQPLINPCESNSELKRLMQQNFGTCSQEELLKLQLLMAQQHQEIPSICNSSSYNADLSSASASNQAILKYVCSKMTSHMLSVAQSNCMVGSDSEARHSPQSVPTTSSKAAPMKKPTHTIVQPQTLSNIKHVVIERKNMPYKIATNSPIAGAIIPVSSLPSSSNSEPCNLIGTVLTSGLNYPSTSPQITAITIPMAHNPTTTKVISNKFVIPVKQCHGVRTSPTSFALAAEAENRNFATSASQSTTGVFIVKNGNAQIISNTPPSQSLTTCLSGPRVVPTIKAKPNTVITKTVPKIIKQAAKKLSKPPVRKPSIVVPKVLVPVSSSQNVKPMPVNIMPDKEQSEAQNLSVKITAHQGMPKSPPTVIEETKSAIILPEVTPVMTSSESIDIKTKDTNNIEVNNLPPCTVDDKLNVDKIILQSAASPKSEVFTSFENSSSRAVTPSPEISLSQSVEQEKAGDLGKTNEVQDNLEIEKELLEKKETEEEKEWTEKEESDSLDKTDENSVAKLPQEISPESTDAQNKESVMPSKANDDVSEKTKEEVFVTQTEVVSPKSPLSPKNAVVPSETDVSAVISDTTSKTFENFDSTNSEIVSEDKNETCSPTKTLDLNSTKQQKELQPITTIDSAAKVSAKVSSQSKTENGTQVSDVPTRSFTSISDAVRFSLMDMDDATDSVENQVLQAFQVSHESSQDSPRYDNPTSEGDANTSSSTAVILTTPQSTSTTELSVSRVSQRFESSVHNSQTEKFSGCQNTVSRTTTWILEESSLNESSQAISVQKSSDIEFSEGKDDDRPKKKRKKKDRVDPESPPKFWCEICSKGFCSAYNLRRHCRNVHKMNLPRGTSDVPFPSSQCLSHLQQTDASPTESSTPRIPYGTVQQTALSPKGSEFMLPSPSRETKSQDFSVKASPSQHGSQIQSSEFQMQTPPRISSQASSTHVSPVTSKDFRLNTPTTATSPQLPQNKLSPVTKSPTSPKFQRLPTSCAAAQVPQLAKISQMQQVALCGQQTLQQQRQLGQLQASGLLQPLPSVACQAQQVQATQCPHFQNKQLVQQRIDQLQLMQHAGQLSSVQHGPHAIQKQTQVQQFKKCSTSQQVTKMTESEQIQQAAQLAQNQHILANQQMQKLIQIRQSAIAASGVASQIALGNTVPVQGSSKSATQCFQSQLAAARQAAAAAQLPASQRSQGTSYSLPSHDASGHQFFPPSIHPSQEQTSCPHSSFSSQNITDFSSATPSYPTIRLSTETNDGLEDLEQFLLENMPWSGDQAASHGLAQQAGNRPSSADSLTLAIPTQVSTPNRTGISGKKGTPISRPKPRKPVATQSSKNLLGNLGRGVKKKSSTKKVKPLESDCIVSKSEGFCQTNIIMPGSHSLHIMQKQNEKVHGMDLVEPKQVKDSVNETDSSDSVQCINVTHGAISKNISMGVNFTNFAPSGLCTVDKNVNSMCQIDPVSAKEMYDISNKNNFLDQCNLVSKTSSNLDQSKNTTNMNYSGMGHSSGTAFENSEKEQNCSYKNYNLGNAPQIYSKKSKTSNAQDIFLGQRNSEESDINSDIRKKLAETSTQGNLSASDAKKECDIKRCLSIIEEMRAKAAKHSDPFLGGSNVNNKSKSSKKCTNNKIVEQKKEIEKKDFITNNNLASTEIFTAPEKETAAIDQTVSAQESCNDVHIECDTKSVEGSNQLSQNHVISNTENSVKISDASTDLVEDMKLEKAPGVILNGNEKSKEKSPEAENSHVENVTKSEVTEVIKNSDEQSLPKVHDFEENTVVFSNVKSEINSKNFKDENALSQKLNNHNENSNHESINLNDENFFSKENNPDNSSCDQGLKQRIALRFRKTADGATKLSDGDKNVKYYVTEKTSDDLKVPLTKKGSQKRKKCKQENNKSELSKTDSKKSVCNKFGGESELQENGLINSEKSFTVEKEINGSVHPLSPCNEIENNASLENEGHENEFCLGKQIHDPCVNEIPTGRLRLRDTPKTSVKRTCPCCVDSQEPKRCRENGTSNLTKKSTLKARNTVNGHSEKVNTRSSSRLRSRNTTVN
ncbi:uncharacterized protein LOC129228593 [Uloborus diversus]|uniref:uncharacterized protein LOC129228593 n=1 Tax=Uloborus diversus TaxID=327109 RepID=UPI00240A37E9|nr:uncharacterized protein LOC129228593 [Uloborus diversus]